MEENYQSQRRRRKNENVENYTFQDFAGDAAKPSS